MSNLREPYDRTFRHNYIYCRYRLIALALARVCDDYSNFISLINISGYKIVDIFFLISTYAFFKNIFQEFQEFL